MVVGDQLRVIDAVDATELEQRLLNLTNVIHISLKVVVKALWVRKLHCYILEQGDGKDVVA